QGEGDIPSTAVTGIVNASALNVRAEASTTAQILGKVYTGETVTILSQENDWYNIKTQSGITGWVLSQYVDVE
ncbi:MAG: SH3 domain-containing protein, partial [Clostridiales bacterium]|nr:SH3 domain-containing protein [Clostridiales bacterium]